MGNKNEITRKKYCSDRCTKKVKNIANFYKLVSISLIRMLGLLFKKTRLWNDSFDAPFLFYPSCVAQMGKVNFFFLTQQLHNFYTYFYILCVQLLYIMGFLLATISNNYWW